MVAFARRWPSRRTAWVLIALVAAGCGRYAAMRGLLPGEREPILQSGSASVTLANGEFVDLVWLQAPDRAVSAEALKVVGVRRQKRLLRAASPAGGMVEVAVGSVVAVTVREPSLSAWSYLWVPVGMLAGALFGEAAGDAVSAHRPGTEAYPGNGANIGMVLGAAAVVAAVYWRRQYPNKSREADRHYSVAPQAWHFAQLPKPAQLPAVPTNDTL